MNLVQEIKPRARGDTLRQYRWYCKHASVDTAERYMTAIDAMILQLSECPHLGAHCRFGGTRFQGFRFIPLDRPFDAYLIFYRFDSTTLEVMRVVHRARDIPRRLREEAPSYGLASPAPVGTSAPASMAETGP
jgi:plasmid stabilization system protein ParE